MDEFHVQRTSAYISQTDNHLAELTVRETLDFAARCQGASDGFAGLFAFIYCLQLCVKLILFTKKSQCNS